jgi:hypothetical protein
MWIQALSLGQQMRSYNMEILNAQFTVTGRINALIDGVEMSIPADAGNRHYAALLGQGIQIVPYVEPPITAEHVRAERDALLAACDWTQVADAPVDQAAWAVYRQALRDVTAQAGFPVDIVWPMKPA